MKNKSTYFRRQKLWAERASLVLTALIFILLYSSCEHESEPSESETLGLDPATSWGHPKKLDLRANVSNDEKVIAFGLVADTHVDATTSKWRGSNANDPHADHWNNSEKMHNNRSTMFDLNLDCKTTGSPHVERDCLGILMVGDMVDNMYVNTTGFTQQLIAFRQLYEHDYNHDGVSVDGGDTGPNAYNLESKYRVQFPVIPMLGNHDVASDDEIKTTGYIQQRVSGAPGMLAEYNKTNFMWRWGRYVFVSLGLWAGSSNWQNPYRMDTGKLDWLRDNLARHAPDSSIGVLIFQHYGWDGGESNQDRYWKQEHKQMEINVLLGRSYSDNSGPIKPYNVIGIFSGHNHWPEELRIVSAGTDASGKPVQFNNFVKFAVRGNSSNPAYGYSVVRLTGTKMYMHTKDKNPNLPGGNGAFWPVGEWDIRILN